jgi:MtN3 and saliva related transmembrane protein
MTQMTVGWTLLGLLAATCTTLSFLPQVIKAWKTKSTSDISIGMFVLLTTGVVLWIVYGAAIGDIPLVAANVATLLLVATILVLKVKHG